MKKQIILGKDTYQISLESGSTIALLVSKNDIAIFNQKTGFIDIDNDADLLTAIEESYHCEELCIELKKIIDSKRRSKNKKAERRQVVESARNAKTRGKTLIKKGITKV